MMCRHFGEFHDSYSNSFETLRAQIAICSVLGTCCDLWQWSVPCAAQLPVSLMQRLNVVQSPESHQRFAPSLQDHVRPVPDLVPQALCGPLLRQRGISRVLNPSARLRSEVEGSMPASVGVWSPWFACFVTAGHERDRQGHTQRPIPPGEGGVLQGAGKLPQCSSAVPSPSVGTHVTWHGNSQMLSTCECCPVMTALQVVPHLYGFAAVLVVALLLLVYWIIW